MATLEPEDSDEIFRRLTDDLDINPVNISVVNVSTLNEAELLSRWAEVKYQLGQRGELLKASTEIGRDLHSEYHAILLELKKRRVL